MPLTGVLVTDTLPLTPDPFIYMRMRTSPGCAAPTLVDGGRKLVWSINLPGFGSTSCSFAVKVPTTIVFSGETTERNFTNALVATHPSTYFSPASGLATVKVLAPLIMSKTVTPSHVLPGETVTYTVILNNRGPFLISSIRLTDTLEGDFHFLDMVMGPDPLPAFSYDPVVWNGLSVPAGQQYELIFTAYADGDWLQTYKNNLIAYSPNADIPNLVGAAPVKIDAPIGVAKTATPTSVFLGQTVEYDVSVFNLSDVVWLMSRFEDILPAGFLTTGTGEDTVTLFFTPPQPIPGGDNWSGSFQALVANVNCADLPRTYNNLAGNINVTFVSPINTTVYNIKGLAPVTVNPNILVDLIPVPKTVQRGGIVTYTLHLENVSPFPAQNSTVAVTLPLNFTYVQTLPGYPQPSNVSGSSPVVITWENLTIWGNSEINIVFTVRASETDGIKSPGFNGSASGVCFGKIGSGDNPSAAVK